MFDQYGTEIVELLTLQFTYKMVVLYSVFLENTRKKRYFLLCKESSYFIITEWKVCKIKSAIEQMNITTTLAEEDTLKLTRAKYYMD